jgi:hypothetical protein
MAQTVERVRRLIVAGRRAGSNPPGPPASARAAAALGAIEGAVIALAGRPGEDETVAERVARGVLGLAAGEGAMG